MAVDASRFAFRPRIHPGQSDTLVHFCGRAVGSASAPVEVQNLTPRQRLDSILSTGELRAFEPFGASWPTVSFSECDAAAVGALIGHGWEPWGVVVRREWVWAVGGGPVWYARTDVARDARSRLDSRTASWIVRTEPWDSEWLHEQEWRVPCPPENPRLPLPSEALVAVIVGDERWDPPSHLGMVSGAVDPGHWRVGERSTVGEGVDRWVWTGREVKVRDDPGAWD